MAMTAIFTGLCPPPDEACPPPQVLIS